MSDHANEILEALGRIIDRENLIRLFHHVLHQQERIMAAVDDLVTQVGALKDELTALKTSNDGLIAAIENWIANHQGSDDPKVVQAVADLQQVVTDAKAVQVADDAETSKLSQG